jgi:cytochrome c oxidase subunit 2
MRRSLRPAAAALAAALAPAAGACDYYERQSVLHAAGPQAAAAERLWWWMFWVAAAVCILVYAALLWAAFRRRRPPAEPGTFDADPAAKRAMTRAVLGAVAATVLVLFAFLAVSFRAGRAVTMPPAGSPLTIELRGHQWWWEVTYADPEAQRRLTTANEIHIPVGRPVVLRLSSADVIHSLWVPNLAGKRDLIPGETATMWLRADRPGVFRGECAEFCGHQHAKMALFVIAEPPDAFAAWYERQLRPAPEPTDSLRRLGQQLFLTRQCVMCHTIEGTPAGSTLGPSLTHVGARRFLAAGTVPNDRGHLAGWILDPQSIKPGVRMPPNQLAPGELHALLAYLESLE